MSFCILHRLAPSRLLDSQETAGYRNGGHARARETKWRRIVAEQAKQMWRHRWIFPPVTPSRLCQSYCIARELTERAVPINLVCAARETRLLLRFYLLSRLVSFSHQQFKPVLEQTLQMSSFVTVPFKSYRNERAIKGLEYDFPQKRKKTAMCQLHTAHETDVNTIKETNSMHTNWCNIFAAKKHQLESISCTWHKLRVPSLLFRAIPRQVSFVFFRAGVHRNKSRAISLARFHRRFYSSGLLRLISKKKRATWGKSTFCIALW